MIGEAFMEALAAAVAPATFANTRGETSGVVITLSDGRIIKVSRKQVARIEHSSDPDEFDAVDQYIQSLVG